MNESDNKPVTSISKARTLQEIADFWDTHSLADYWKQTREVDFEVRVARQRRVTLDPEIYAGVEAQAHTRGLVPETLVNLWLADRLHGVTTTHDLPAMDKRQGAAAEERLRKIRAQYPKAYEKWTEEEDASLKDNFSKGTSIKEISKLLQRQPGAVRSRLIKLGLISITGES